MCHTVTQANFPVHCLLDTYIEIRGVSANSQIKHILRTCLTVVIILTHLPLYSRAATLKTIFIHKKAYKVVSQLRGLSTTQCFINKFKLKRKKTQNLKWNVLIHSVVFNSVCCKFTVKLQLAI